MIEKILKRFVSEECRIVIVALEKLGTSETTDAQETAVDRMCTGIRDYGTWADKYILKRTLVRLDKGIQKRKIAARREVALSRSSELAAKLLMGGRMEGELWGISRPAPSTASVSQAYAQLAGMQGAVGNLTGNQNPYSPTSAQAQAYADSTRVSQRSII
jgi:hypothetical protein